MASISNEQFLSTCLKHMEGKIDFKAVANELGLKEPATRMRWTRWKAKIDSATSGGDNGGTAGDAGEENGINGVGTPKKTPKKSPAKKSTPKKRKVDETGDDDEEKIKAEEE